MENNVQKILIKRLKKMKELSESQQLDFIEEVEHRPEIQELEASMKQNIADANFLHEQYIKLLQQKPQEFDTVYTAIDIITKNNEATNDKFQIIGGIINEFNKQLITLTKHQLQINAVLTKLVKIIDFPLSH